VALNQSNAEPWKEVRPLILVTSQLNESNTGSRFEQHTSSHHAAFNFNSSNSWQGEFLVGSVEKKALPVPGFQSTGKIDRLSHRVTGPCMRAEHMVQRFYRVG
jgi:hypothetical protein